MKFEMDKVVEKSEKLMKKGEDIAKDVFPKVKEATSDLKESISAMVDKSVQGAQSIFEKREDLKADTIDLISDKKKEVNSMISSKNNKKSTGKIVAGAAIAAAAAAAYAMYKKNKIRNEKLKEEYAEKLTRWAELDMSQLETEADALNTPIKLLPDKIYKMGSNATLGNIVVNVSSPSESFSFNPNEPGEPLADLGLKKAFFEKTSAVKDKLKAKIEEGKLQTKLGTMEAKDKYVEIKDLAEEKIGEVKSKVDDTITPNMKEKAEELKLEAEIKAEEVKEDLAEKKEEAKKKFDHLKSQMAKSTEELEEKAEEKLDPSDGFMKNDMAIDGDDEFIPTEDEFVDAPFGAQEMVDESKDEAKEESDGLKEKAKHLAEAAKEKLRPEKPPVDLKDLVEYNISIHNKGEEDYTFNPMQLQLYDLMKRSVYLVPKHDEGTTLGRVVIKPGETYTGKLFVKKNVGKKQGILFFEDLSLTHSVLFLGKGEEPVEVDTDLVLDEDYLYSDEEVLEEHVDYKRL